MPNIGEQILVWDLEEALAHPYEFVFYNDKNPRWPWVVRSTEGGIISCAQARPIKPAKEEFSPYDVVTNGVDTEELILLRKTGLSCAPYWSAFCPHFCAVRSFRENELVKVPNKIAKAPALIRDEKLSQNIYSLIEYEQWRQGCGFKRWPYSISMLTIHEKESL